MADEFHKTTANNLIVEKVVERTARAIVRGYTRDDRREVTERDREIAWAAIRAVAADNGGVWVVERLVAGEDHANAE